MSFYYQKMFYYVYQVLKLNSEDGNTKKKKFYRIGPHVILLSLICFLSLTNIQQKMEKFFVSKEKKFYRIGYWSILLQVLPSDAQQIIGLTNQTHIKLLLYFFYFNNLETYFLSDFHDFWL